MRKISPPTGIWSQTVHPIGSCYTDSATRPTDTHLTMLKYCKTCAKEKHWTTICVNQNVWSLQHSIWHKVQCRWSIFKTIYLLDMEHISCTIKNSKTRWFLRAVRLEEKIPYCDMLCKKLKPAIRSVSVSSCILTFGHTLLMLPWVSQSIKAQGHFVTGYIITKATKNWIPSFLFSLLHVY